MKYRTLIYDEERKKTHITKQLVEEYFYPLGSATYIHCMSEVIAVRLSVSSCDHNRPGQQSVLRIAAYALEGMQSIYVSFIHLE